MGAVTAQNCAAKYYAMVDINEYLSWLMISAKSRVKYIPSFSNGRVIVGSIDASDSDFTTPINEDECDPPSASGQPICRETLLL